MFYNYIIYNLFILNTVTEQIHEVFLKLIEMFLQNQIQVPTLKVIQNWSWNLEYILCLFIIRGESNAFI